MNRFSTVISWFGRLAGAAMETAEALEDGASTAESTGLTDTVVSEARDFLTKLVTEIENPSYTVANLSPLDFAEKGIDFSGSEVSVLKETAASFYRLMLIIGAGGMVLSIMIGAVMLGLRGERVKHEVFSSLLTKTAVVIMLLGFVGVFGAFGTIANQLAEALTVF